MRRSIGLALPAFLIIANLQAQKPNPPAVATSAKLTEASAESVNMSTARLQRIDRVVKEYIDKGKIPGAVGLVIRDGKSFTTVPSDMTTRKKKLP